MKRVTILLVLGLMRCISLESKAVPATIGDMKSASAILQKENSSFVAISELRVKRQFNGGKFENLNNSQCYTGAGTEKGSLSSQNYLLIELCPTSDGLYSVRVSQNVNGVFKAMNGRTANVSLLMSENKKIVHIKWDGETVESGNYANPIPFAGMAVGEISN